MFFALSKIVDILASPITWAMLLVVFGVVRGRGRFRRHRRARVYAPLAAVVVLYVFSIGPVANALFGGLEAGATRTMRDDVVYDAVIVLGGLVSAETSETHGTTEYNDSVERILSAYDILRAGRAKNVLLSGGSPEADTPDAVEAHVLAAQLERWGIDPSRIAVEDKSRNTRENAVESAAIVRDRGWSTLLLVTSAFHIPRAAGCFRAVGLTVDTLPVDYRAYDASRFTANWLPRADHLAESTAAIREWVGRAVYRVQGYTKD
jgi:uncharacterized SAM-binding protein YcdF (DUF218 family)